MAKSLLPLQQHFQILLSGQQGERKQATEHKHIHCFNIHSSKIGFYKDKKVMKNKKIKPYIFSYHLYFYVNLGFSTIYLSGI